VFGVSKVEASSGLEATAVWHEKDIARLEATAPSYRVEPSSSDRLLESVEDIGPSCPGSV
jgi:hypothetical protein